SAKAARFSMLRDAFTVPLVFRHDGLGFLVGVAVVRQGIFRHGAKMIAAMASAEVPKFSVVLRKAYAAGFYAMGAPGFGPRATIALPTASIAAMGVDAAVNAMYAAKLHTLPDDERADSLTARRAEYEADLGLLSVAGQLVGASVGPPGALRAELVARLAAADGWSRSPHRRHHGAFPV